MEKVFVCIAVVCWMLTIVFGSGMIRIKNDLRAAVVSWIFLAVGVAFFSLAITSQSVTPSGVLQPK
jgi:ABC-type Mn2+/Zn2+ transport system permease subunit